MTELRADEVNVQLLPIIIIATEMETDRLVRLIYITHAYGAMQK